MPFFPYDLPPGELLCQNSFHDNMVNNGARDLLFFLNIPYLTILNTLEVSKNTFSHQNITFYAFFSIRPPTRGSCFNFFQAHSLLSMRVSLEWLFNMLSIQDLSKILSTVNLLNGHG